VTHQSTSPAPPTTTAALLVNDRGQYLLHLRDANKPIDAAGMWSLPGGDLQVPGLVPFVDVDRVDGDGTIVARVRVHLGRWNGDPARLPLTEGIQLRWTDAAQLRWLTMDPGTTAVIHHHRERPQATPGSEGALPALRFPASADTRTVRNVIGGHLYLEQDGAVLLGRRHPDSFYAPSTWHVPAGHCELESVRACVVREAAEELGISVAERDLTLVHTVHMTHPGNARPRLQLFFAASHWQGEPQLMEPDRCTEWKFWPLTALPTPLVPYTGTALAAIGRGEAYSETGWNS